jgi:hypothetical protein
MTFFAETLPVLGAVVVVMAFSVFFCRSLLELMFGAMRRTRVGRQVDAASE